MQVLGISGKAETGKDYTAKYLCDTAGFVPFSLAWHFKIWIVGQGLATYDEVFVTKPPHVRKLLQEYGTEKGRVLYGENIWCDTTTAWLKLLGETWKHDKIVIPDIRFPNEVEMVRKLGGRVIRLSAPQRVANSRLSLEAREHISETALDGYEPFDWVLDNDLPDRPDWAAMIPQLLTHWGWDQAVAA